MFPHLQAHGVQYLMHFTKAGNLPGILRHGLLSRQELAVRGIQHSVNDQHRFDNLPAVCLSVSFPNYKMFYALRLEQPNEDWAVIVLRAELIQNKRCIFSHANAARRDIANLPLEQRMTSDALHAMFADHDDMPPRATLNIPGNCPTNPQAEILVLDPIEPAHIVAVCFDGNERGQQLNRACTAAINGDGSPTFACLPQLFSARVDFAHWRAPQNG